MGSRPLRSCWRERSSMVKPVVKVGWGPVAVVSRQVSRSMRRRALAAGAKAASTSCRCLAGGRDSGSRPLRRQLVSKIEPKEGR